MSKIKKSKTTNPNQPKEGRKEQKSEKSNTLIFGGLLLAFVSIALLIFVLSEKIFLLNQ